MIPDGTGIVLNVFHEWPLKCSQSLFVFEPFRESIKDRQVRGPFQVQHPPSLLRLIVLFETDLSKRLQDLTATVVDAVWRTNERHNQIPICSLIEQNFRV